MGLQMMRTRRAQPRRYDGTTRFEVRVQAAKWRYRMAKTCIFIDSVIYSDGLRNLTQRFQ